jgi:2-keto-4-pentenoate hydratase/2-oxohepta-3-ene-1,7-dioic acid hydratase in catechol pathway
MPPSALLDPEADVILPACFRSVLAEGEIAVVIGKKAKGISADPVAGHIWGTRWRMIFPDAIPRSNRFLPC